MFIHISWITAIVNDKIGTYHVDGRCVPHVVHSRVGRIGWMVMVVRMMVMVMRGRRIVHVLGHHGHPMHQASAAAGPGGRTTLLLQMLRMDG